MAKKFGPTIKKLQNAINNAGEHLVVNKTQYYVDKDQKFAEVVIVKKATVQENGKVKYEEIFSSGSDVAIVLFLRDYWYELNGWEIPTDNEKWNETKQKYYTRRENRKNGGQENSKTE